MNRLEYLTSLRYNLEKGGLPQSDIEDALSYYEEIFLDSGYGSDEQTANSLGTPEELAREILMDSGIHVDGDAEFAVGEVIKDAQKAQAQDVEFEEVGKETDTQNANTGYGYNYNYNYNAGNTGTQRGSGFYDSFNSARDNFKDSMNSAYNYARDGINNFKNSDVGSSINSSFSSLNSGGKNNALKIVILVLTFPIWFSLLITVISLAFSLVVALFSLVIGLACVPFGLLIGGFTELGTNPPEAIMMIGWGLITCGLFIMLGRPILRGAVRLASTAVDGCKKLCNKIFGKGGY